MNLFSPIPHSAPEPIPTASLRGFTLLEVIVVTAIIGIMASFLVGILIQDNDRVARLEAGRFLAVMNELMDEAILTGAAYKVSFSTSSYTIEPLLTTESSGSIDGLLGERRLAEGITLAVTIFDIAEEDETLDRRVVVEPLGEVSEFEVVFIGDNSEYWLTQDNKGQLVISEQAR